MMVVLNPNAGGGAALLRWKRIEPELRRRCGRFDLEVLEAPHRIGPSVSARFNAGESQFVAAGGDGTVNALGRAALNLIPAEGGRRIAIGAIGLGSSNDFHKPVSPDRCIGGVPCAVDFTSATPRDVGVVTIGGNGGADRRYFLVNASVGLTAQANRFFNTPDPILRGLKGRWTRAAILYAALTTILHYANARAKVSVDDGAFQPIEITNLAVLKSPHVSGNLRFPGAPDYASGLFLIHLLCYAGRLTRLRFLCALSGGRPPATAAIESRRARKVTVMAETGFPVEFDGEVVETTEATFSLLPQRLRVCRC